MQESTVLVAASRGQVELYKSLLPDTVTLVSVETVAEGLEAYDKNSDLDSVLVNSCFGQGGNGRALIDGLVDRGFAGRIVVRACKKDCCAMKGLSIPVYDDHYQAVRAIKKHLPS